MAENTRPRPAPVKTPEERGVFANIIIWIVQIPMYLVLSLFVSILVEWAGMAGGLWDEPGAQHSKVMLQEELQYLETDFARSAIVERPAQYAHRFADNFYDLTFKKTGLQAAVIWLARPTETSSRSIRKTLHHIFLMVKEYVLAAENVTKTFAVQIAILILAMPAFLLLGAMGMIDGMVQRDIRRWSGGRESSYIYHWAKNALHPSLVLPWIIYLSIPVSVHPDLVILPGAVLFAVSLMVMSSSFKKYL